MGANIDLVNRAAGNVLDVKKQRVYTIKDRQCVYFSYNVISLFVNTFMHGCQSHR